MHKFNVGDIVCVSICPSTWYRIVKVNEDGSLDIIEVKTNRKEFGVRPGYYEKVSLGELANIRVNLREE